MGKHDLEEKLREYEEAREQYLMEKGQIEYALQQGCNQYNSLMSLINVERHLMRKEISKLYKFLRQYGNIGTKITPFDFKMEDWQTVQFNAGKASNMYYDANRKKGDPNVATFAAGVMGVTAGTMGAATAGGFAGMAGITASTFATLGAIPIVLPVALPAYALIKGIGSRKSEKEQLLQLTEKSNKEKLSWKKHIEDGRDELAFINMASSIADIYRLLLTSVKDAIADTIIPEINSINAFLYADAIKNCIINNEDPNDAVVADIREYRGTPYEQHYMFIRNTFDYYQLITKFFTEPILTNILNDHKITKQEYDEFMNEVKSIRDKQDKLRSNMVFGGEEDGCNVC